MTGIWGKMGKMELLLTRDCETGYGPDPGATTVTIRQQLAIGNPSHLYNHFQAAITHSYRGFGIF